MRGLLSLILLLVAGVLTLPAALAAWEQRVLTNEDRFVELGNKVLSEDAVQQELARVLTKDFAATIQTGVTSINQLIGGSPLTQELTNLVGSFLGPATGPGNTPLPGLGNLIPGIGGAIPGLGGPIPGLTPAQPTPVPPAPGQPPKPASNAGLEAIVNPIALDLVRALPNSDVADASLRITHGLILSAVRSDVVRPEDDLIVLDVSDGFAGMLPELGIIGNVQGSGDVGRIVLVRRSGFADYFKVARWFDGNAVYFILLPIAVVAVGFFIAPNRAIFLAQTGLVVALSAGLWIVLLKGPVKSSSVEDALMEQSARNAANAAYDAIVASYVQQEIIVAVAGGVLFILGLVLSSSNRSRPAVR